jgi:hypothetical protein
MPDIQSKMVSSQEELQNCKGLKNQIFTAENAERQVRIFYRGRGNRNGKSEGKADHEQRRNQQ